MVFMKNPFLKNGILLAIFSIVLSMVFYLFAKQYLASFWIIPLTVVYFLAFMAKAILDKKASNGGFVSFGEALIQSYVTGVIGALIGSIFVYVLYNIYDPGLSDEIMQQTMKNLESMDGLISEEANEEILEGMDEIGTDMGIDKVIISFFTNSILGIFFSIALSAIMKKNKPMFDLETTDAV